jgi:hypothetical protein
MADQNRSNKRPMNSMADDIDYSSTLTELERIGARASRKGIQRTELEDRIRGEGKLLNSLLDEGRRTPIIREGPFYDQQVSSMRANIQGLRSKMNSLDATSRSRAESEASTYISRQFGSSAINGQVSGMMREEAVQNRAFGMMGSSYDELQSRRNDIMADVRLRERNALNEVKGMYSGRGEVNPERSAALGVMLGGAQSQFRELAVLSAAQSVQRGMGMDPNSRMKNLAMMGQQANQILSADSIAREVQSGSVNISSGGSMRGIANDDINKEIISQARALSQALKELADGAGKTDEELAKLRNTADESAGNLEKLKEAQGMGGGGGRGTIMGYLGAAGGAFNAIGGAAQQLLVGQRMQDVGNIGGFAGLANQQYDMYSKARSGDIASQLALSQFGDADAFGMEMKRGTNAAQSAYLAAGGLQTAAGGMQIAEGLKNAPTAGYLNSGVGNNIAQGAQNVAQGLATTAVTSADMARGTSAQSARLGGIQAQMQARMAINAVGARQAQGLRDFYTGLDVVGQEMGGRSSAFIQNSIGGDNLQKMMDSRLSPEQFAQMSQVGAANMGSTFDANQVFGARNAERAGFGSMQTNMQRMSTLAGAGANNPREGMENVLSAAMAKGLDSSKAISMMVENTAAMVSSSAGAAVGIDTVGASSSLLASSMNPALANKEFALQQAMTAQEITRAQTTNRDVSFTGMANTAGLQSNLAKVGIGISGTEALIAQGVDVATLKSLQGDPTKAAEFFKNKGVNINKDNAQQFLDTTLMEKQKQILRPGGLAINADLEGIRRRANEGKLSGQDDLALGQIAELQGRKGGRGELLRELTGITAPNIAPGAGQAIMSGQGGDDIKKQMDTLRTSGFKQLTEAAASASKDLEKFGGALKVFSDLQNKFEEGGVGNEKGFSTAASEMARDFKASTVVFKDSVGDFAAAVKELSNKAGLRSNGVPVVPNSMTDMLNQSKSSTRGK